MHLCSTLSLQYVKLFVNPPICKQSVFKLETIGGTLNEPLVDSRIKKWSPILGQGCNVAFALTGGPYDDGQATQFFT